MDPLIALVDSARRLPAKAPDRIIGIAARICNEPNAEYPIAELARECGCSISSFAAAFKQSKGLPLHAFLLNCRIRRAEQLLLKTNRTVASIGQELRFCSTQHFARTFRRIVGVNPNDYRIASRQP